MHCLQDTTSLHQKHSWGSQLLSHGARRLHNHSSTSTNMCSVHANVLTLDSPSPSSLSPSPSSPSSKATITLPIPRTRSRRDVSFRDTRTEIFVESLARLSEAERDQLWYNDTEIESFKARERQLCEDVKLGLTKENTRGLELRLCHDRQRRKYMILQAVLRAQKRYRDPKQLSNIARKCNGWSKTVAVIVAQRDYYDLYEPAKLATIASFPPLKNYPLPFRPKDPSVKIPVKRPMSPAIPQGNVRPRPIPSRWQGNDLVV
jgi:hypothetical protein